MNYHGLDYLTFFSIASKVVNSFIFCFPSNYKNQFLEIAENIKDPHKLLDIYDSNKEWKKNTSIETMAKLNTKYFIKMGY